MLENLSYTVLDCIRDSIYFILQKEYFKMPIYIYNAHTMINTIRELYNVKIVWKFPNFGGGGQTF